MSDRELFAVEERMDGKWRPMLGLVAQIDAVRHVERADEPEEHRVTRYVPEDETPRLLADWQQKNDGQVMWSSTSQQTTCALCVTGRAAVGESGPCDPFGAAKDALKRWEAQWGATA